MVLDAMDYPRDGNPNPRFKVTADDIRKDVERVFPELLSPRFQNAVGAALGILLALYVGLQLGPALQFLYRVTSRYDLDIVVTILVVAMLIFVWMTLRPRR